MPPRTRMSVQARREQLLRIGVELLSVHGYDDVWVETVAERAGVSRGLLYHYFPTKRDFVAAVVSSESEKLLDLIATEPQQSVPEQLYAGLDAYLSYVEEHQNAYRMLHEGALTTDVEIRQIVTNALRIQEERILTALASSPDGAKAALDGRADTMVRLAVRGWLAFTIAICLEWLDDPSIARHQVREICAQTLLSSVAAAASVAQF